MKFYTADLHFNHLNIIAYEKRPFKDVDEMNTQLILNWNKKVGPDDEVYILGDFCFDNNAKYVNNFLKRLNGKKYLIKGNHDSFLNSKNFDPSDFEWIKQYAEIKDGDYDVILFHYPIAVWNKKHHGSIHFYGHIHSNKAEPHPLPWDIGEAYNVGVDVRDYEPKTLKEILKSKKHT